jgi:NAD(P)-dependent dehydrogenase (short-subunit alcohol dehydrogenase family)
MGKDVQVNKGPRPVTVITGASRGIGASTALHLAAAGHDVAIGYRADRHAAERIAAAASASGAHAVAVRADVTDEDQVNRLFDTVADQLGPISGLVNNAGATMHVGDLADTPVETIRRVVDVNLLAVLLCCRRAAQVMSTRRDGHGGAIVNVSSAAASLGSPHEYVHYAAAKAGIDALTVGLAKELADDGIRVNAVAPGVVRTDIHAAAGDPHRLDRVAARIPLRRPGEPNEIAPAIAWLLGEHASYTTGAVLRVAGGL